MASTDVKNIEIRSGINDTLKGFCTVIINHGDLLGQLTPDKTRNMALQWLEVAEAAHTDEVITKVLMDNGFELEHALQLLVMIRDAR